MDMMDAREAQWMALTATVSDLEASAAAADARMQAAEAKVAALETGRRADRLRSFLGLIACAAVSWIGALAVGVHAQTTPQTLVCKDLQVVGDDGKTRVHLGNSSETNCGYMQTFNAAGIRLVNITFIGDSHDGSIGTYSGTSGKELARISAVKHANDNHYDGSFETFNADGKDLIQLTTDDKDNGVVIVNAKDGTFSKSLP